MSSPYEHMKKVRTFVDTSNEGSLRESTEIDTLSARPLSRHSKDQNGKPCVTTTRTRTKR